MSGGGAMASSGSSWSPVIGGSSRSAAWSVPSTSPILYRERPQEYAPTILCHCGEKAGRWISWSDSNQSHRYLTCMRARVGGCRFWAWADDEITPFMRQVLLDLRDVVRALRKEKSELSEGISDAIQELSEVKSRDGECVAALTAKLREQEASLVGLGARVGPRARPSPSHFLPSGVGTASGLMLKKRLLTGQIDLDG